MLALRMIFCFFFLQLKDKTELNETKTQVCLISNGKYVLYSLPSLRILISTTYPIFPVLLHVTSCAGNQNTEQYFLLKRQSYHT